MKTKISFPLLLVAIIFLVGVVVFGLRFILGGNEDSWICVNNQWTKHGNPASPKPEKGCGTESSQKTH